MATKRYRVHGKVQGVGFRQYTQKKAKSLGLAGWVRNCADGTVEVLASGAESSLQELERVLSHGPDSSTVTKLVTESLMSDPLNSDPLISVSSDVTVEPGQFIIERSI